MRRVFALLSLVSVLAFLAILSGCARETSHGTMRQDTSTLSGEGMDGGVEASEPKSYLRNMP
ncbi:MAG: hypothetical protein PF961_12195 [Planctomycetota bacterium]|jgi:ABC-type uncharacterized transport system auxiliary subunit|nr:hypothetical protein [Planctomycetota bacterium]